MLDRLGIAAGDLKDRLEQMLGDARTLFEKARERSIKPDEGDADIADLFLRPPKDQIESWARAIAQAQAGAERTVVQGPSLDASAICSAASAVETVEEYVAAVEKWKTDQALKSAWR